MDNSDRLANNQGIKRSHGRFFHAVMVLDMAAFLFQLRTERNEEPHGSERRF